MIEADRDRDLPDPEGWSGQAPGSESRTNEPESAQEADSEASLASPGIQSYIGAQLRAVFDDVVKQPIPDRFLELMRRLD